MNFKSLLKKLIPCKLWKIISIILFFLRLPLKHISLCFNYIIHNRDQFEYTLSVAAMIKNEEAYIKEWIEYHKLVGVDKFIIYDNNSTDNTKKLLKPYIENGDVDYYFYPKTQADFEKEDRKTEYWEFQAHAYNNVIKNYKNKSKWIAFIDIDEFIVPVKNNSIINVINEIKNDMGRKPFVGLAVNWVMYGYSGHEITPKGLVIENFKKNDGIHKNYKSIVNPRTVIQYHVHAGLHLFNIEIVNEQCKDAYQSDVKRSSIEKIRINHYFTKSYKEYVQKTIKNRAGWPGATKYDIPEYDPNYLSNLEDNVIDRFIPLLKQRL